MIKCSFLQGLKTSVGGFEATLNFQKFKVALNPLYRMFLNLAKSCMLSYLSQFYNKKWGPLNSFLSYKCLKLIAGHIVAIVTCYATKLTATC